MARGCRSRLQAASATGDAGGRGAEGGLDRVLWIGCGRGPPPTATATAQVYVSQLRKLLGAEVIATRAPGYALARRG